MLRVLEIKTICYTVVNLIKMTSCLALYQTVVVYDADEASFRGGAPS